MRRVFGFRFSVFGDSGMSIAFAKSASLNQRVSGGHGLTCPYAGLILAFLCPLIEN
jgi:hypothetical protein